GTDSGSVASRADRVTTTVSSPVGGPISITETPEVTQAEPPSYTFVGYQVTIDAFPTNDPAIPLRFEFAIDASLIPDGTDPLTLEVFRNSVVVLECTGTLGPASPDPCATPPAVGGGVLITVYTSHASAYNFAPRPGPPPFPFTGFFQPVDNTDSSGRLILNRVKAGKAIPVKFSLGGYLGMDVV